MTHQRKFPSLVDYFLVYLILFLCHFLYHLNQTSHIACSSFFKFLTKYTSIAISDLVSWANQLIYPALLFILSFLYSLIHDPLLILFKSGHSIISLIHPYCVDLLLNIYSHILDSLIPTSPTLILFFNFWVAPSWNSSHPP